MSKLRIGVVGVGFMGQLHARTIAESETAVLAAVVDTSELQGKRIAEQFGASYFADIDQARTSGTIDAFVVAVPDRQHMEITCHLLELGLPVLVEKPMAHNLAAARQMAEAEKKGVDGFSLPIS